MAYKQSHRELYARTHVLPHQYGCSRRGPTQNYDSAVDLARKSEIETSKLRSAVRHFIPGIGVKNRVAGSRMGSRGQEWARMGWRGQEWGRGFSS